jgi:hypothetical protein
MWGRLVERWWLSSPVILPRSRPVGWRIRNVEKGAFSAEIRKK